MEKNPQYSAVNRSELLQHVRRKRFPARSCGSGWRGCDGWRHRGGGGARRRLNDDALLSAMMQTAVVWRRRGWVQRARDETRRRHGETARIAYTMFAGCFDLDALRNYSDRVLAILSRRVPNTILFSWPPPRHGPIKIDDNYTLCVGDEPIGVGEWRHAVANGNAPTQTRGNSSAPAALR